MRARSTGETNTNWPHGEFLNFQNGTSAIHFTGQLYDSEDNLDVFPARSYSPTLGRFLTPDPSGLAAVNLADPQSLNRYAYVENSPLAATDPSGLDPCPPGTPKFIAYCATGTAWPIPPGDGGDYSFNFEAWAARGDLLQFQEEQAYFAQGSSGGSVGGGLTANPSGPTDTNPTPPARQGLLSCASAFADKYSIAGGLHALGIGNSGGIGGFLTNALGGNTFSGIVEGFTRGESTVGLAFAGAYQGLGGSTPAEKGLSGLATDAVARGFWSAATGAGQTITTLGGETSLASTAITAAKFGDIVGWAKLAYDGLSFAAGLAACAGN